jgi:hypothetical protein
VRRENQDGTGRKRFGQRRQKFVDADKTSGESIKKEETTPGANNVNTVAKLERENRELKAQLKKALNDRKGTKVVMDTYKWVSKEQRDKVQLMATVRRRFVLSSRNSIVR